MVDEAARSSKRALVLLAEGAEEMEATISVDVLRRGGVDVVLAGIDGAQPVVCSRKVRIVPDCALVDAKGAFDAVVLPGGAEGARRLAESAAVGRILREFEGSERLVGVICAAPMALVKHGVFAGRAMTCHPSVKEMVQKHGKLTAGHVVSDGQLITGEGPGTAFEFALALVERLVGRVPAAEVRSTMMLGAIHGRGG